MRPDNKQSRKAATLFVAATTMFLGACGNESQEIQSKESMEPRLTAVTLGEQEVLSVSEYLALEPYKSANRKNGEQQAQICRACHSLEEGGPNTIGPALHGFFGRPVGAVESFSYSPVMQDADFVWTPRALDAWLAQPGRFLPGNRMTFAGVSKPSDRDALIAYLLFATGSE